jgi:hypothetical protein
MKELPEAAFNAVTASAYEMTRETNPAAMRGLAKRFVMLL